MQHIRKELQCSTSARNCNAAHPQGTAMQHIRKELQCSTSARNCKSDHVCCLSGDRQGNSSFWVHTLCPHLNTTRQHKHETRKNAHCHRSLNQKSIRVGPT